MPKADRPDIEIGAALKAKKLRFDRVPETEVRYAGDSRSATERENLPREVQSGVTYRDVEIHWHAHAHARAAGLRVDDE